MLFFFQTYFPGITNDSALAEAGPTRRWLFERTAAGDYGRFYVISNGFCAALLCWLPYNFLVQFTMLLMSSTAALFMYAFVWLRRNKPDMPRAFKIPTWLAVPVVIMPVVITAANTVLLLEDPEPLYVFVAYLYTSLDLFWFFIFPLL